MKTKLLSLLLLTLLAGSALSQEIDVKEWVREADEKNEGKFEYRCIINDH